MCLPFRCPKPFSQKEMYYCPRGFYDSAPLPRRRPDGNTNKTDGVGDAGWKIEKRNRTRSEATTCVRGLRLPCKIDVPTDIVYVMCIMYSVRSTLARKSTRSYRCEPAAQGWPTYLPTRKRNDHDRDVFFLSRYPLRLSVHVRERSVRRVLGSRTYTQYDVYEITRRRSKSIFFLFSTFPFRFARTTTLTRNVEKRVRLFFVFLYNSAISCSIERL